ADIGAKISIPADAEKIDCKDLVLAPGMVDMRCQIGEPGLEHKENIHTASAAAAAGGVTSLACLPNTSPVIDDVSQLELVTRRARDLSPIKIHVQAALSRNTDGKEMSEIGLLHQAGAIAFTD